jgi:hypothetical protein
LKLTVLFIYSQTPTGGSASRHRPKQLFQGNENADPANLTASDLDDFPDLLSVSDEVMGQSPNPPASQVLQQIQNVMAGKMFLKVLSVVDMDCLQNSVADPKQKFRVLFRIRI